MKLLFITSTRLGDAVLSTGLLDHLVAGDGVETTVVCGPVAAEIFECLPGLERVIVLDKEPRKGHWFGLWRQTVGTWWDLVVDLRASAVPFILMRTRRRTKFRGGAGHRVESLARWYGVEPIPSPRVWTDGTHRRHATRLVPGGGPVLGLAPTASGREKIWPWENYVALARRLISPDGALAGGRIVIMGGPAEHDLTQPVVEALPHETTLDLTGSEHLLTLAEVMRQCSVVIANDSGLMHLAAASGAPTVGLFGPSPVETYAPWGASAAAVTSTTGSMNDIAVDAVERAVGKLLER
ncbi:MAG: glycosyltransferase family 9 protein [bacterium]|nr:glycosyltransferase family 9 protein [bacterium]